MIPLDLNLEVIPDAATRASVQALLNLVEQLWAENLALRAEIQRLRDEIQQLKRGTKPPQHPAQALAAARPAFPARPLLRAGTAGTQTVEEGLQAPPHRD